MPHFEFNLGKTGPLRTLFTQLMLERGILGTTSFYTTFAHRQEHIERYLGAVNEVLPLLAEAVHADNVEKLLEGPVAHSGFQRLT